MNDNKTVRVSGGISLPTVVFIVFLILKLTNVIDWSWWWVTAPLWISFGLGLVVLLIYTIVLLCIYGARKRELNKMRKWGKRFGNQRFTW